MKIIIHDSIIHSESLVASESRATQRCPGATLRCPGATKGGLGATPVSAQDRAHGAGGWNFRTPTTTTPEFQTKIKKDRALSERGRSELYQQRDTRTGSSLIQNTYLGAVFRPRSLLVAAFGVYCSTTSTTTTAPPTTTLVNADAIASKDSFEGDNTFTEGDAICQTPSKPKHYGSTNKKMITVFDANEVFYDSLEDTKRARRDSTWRRNIARRNLEHKSQGIFTPHSPDNESTVLESMLFRGVMAGLLFAQKNKKKNKSILEKPLDYSKDGDYMFDTVQQINDLWTPKCLEYGILLTQDYHARLLAAPASARSIGGDYYQMIDDEKVLMAEGKEFLHEYNYRDKVLMLFVQYYIETNSTALFGKRQCFSTSLLCAYHIKKAKQFLKEEKDACIPTGEKLQSLAEEYQIYSKTATRAEPFSAIDMIEAASSPTVELPSPTASNVDSAVAATLVPDTPVAQPILQQNSMTEFQLWQKEHSDRQLNIQEQLSEALVKSTQTAHCAASATAKANETCHEQSKTINTLLQSRDNIMAPTTPKGKGTGKKPQPSTPGTPLVGMYNSSVGYRP
eukprot:scaffold34913_cov172-Amphora_coffeaeformis.AAC.1